MKRISVAIMAVMVSFMCSMSVMADQPVQKTNKGNAYGHTTSKNFNAGVGNGGETPIGTYDPHEGCPIDRDPGKSGENNKAAKNDKTPWP